MGPFFILSGNLFAAAQHPTCPKHLTCGHGVTDVNPQFLTRLAVSRKRVLHVTTGAFRPQRWDSLCLPRTESRHQAIVDSSSPFALLTSFFGEHFSTCCWHDDPVRRQPANPPQHARKVRADFAAATTVAG